ncbi:MAG: ribonuclease P protein component [Chlamydiia bacterium]|nr:ribonuclease P protein component [Chlamydiia bacterium]
MTKQDRLRYRSEFQRVSREAKRWVGQRLCIDCRKGSSALKLGITAPRKYGSAPERSRFKRLIREVFRLHRAHLPQSWEILVMPRQRAKGASFFDIEAEFYLFLNTHAQ